MPEPSQAPTHYRFLSALKALGPYVREKQCRDGHYFFDCLAFCVDIKKSPELREFWGWSMELERQGDGYFAKYYMGMYNDKGDWVTSDIPTDALSDVNTTQDNFHQALTNMIKEKFESEVNLHQDSVAFSE
ncbi:sigma factor-binding protein Crl [Vibrio sp.]|nr:sigma factor-binding protein Crl [Vibrio sp.]